MDLLTTAREHLPVLLVLILPGFISMRVFELLVPTRSSSTGRDALEALSYGAVNFGIWAVPILYWLPSLQVRPLRATLAAILLLIVSPTAKCQSASGVAFSAEVGDSPGSNWPGIISSG